MSKKASFVDDLPKSTLVELNDHNGASAVTYSYAKRLAVEFPDDHLYGVQMGIAYGGGVERMARLWSGRGDVYGYDTFEGHPTHLVEDPQDREATCMDHWYRPDIYGTKKLDYGYQSEVLKDLTNAHLIKGEVNAHSCDGIPHIHFALLDMDILPSMLAGYEAVSDKIVIGGYLLLHDVVTHNNIPRLYEWYNNEIKPLPIWDVVYEDEGTHLAVLKRK